MLDPESSELIALAAIEALDDRSMQLADDYAATSVELERELAEMREAVGCIPYGNPTLPISSNLKERLFQRIAAEEDRATPQPTQPASIAITAAERVWQPHPVPGLTMSVLHMDRATRQITSLIRCEPGAYYPEHSHAGTEEIFMLEGDFVCEGKTYSSGDYIVSASGSKHPPISTRDGCLFLVRASLDDRMGN
ncbi:cupin domain-containing protein [Pseudanabaena sp. PCC 6802]|uniref:cupin domain-containing protein n=1 Tax=Pseudanabaena sp. PCC 6802 TaxID=118173 RepID=UPI00034AD145|nr:cupin domain-containing protein [Pseudanabaena sp. PCC 6802]